MHGGLTFADEEPCTEEDGKGWWFGFDFAHCDDAMYDPNPNWASLSVEGRRNLETMGRINREVERDMGSKFPDYIGRQEHYWTQAEAERECEALADQLAAVWPSNETAGEMSRGTDE